MAAWPSEAFKLFRNRSNLEPIPSTDTTTLRNNSIGVHIQIQRSYFMESPRTREILCLNPGHRFHLRKPHTPVKQEKKEKPKSLSISLPLPYLPIIAFQDLEPLVGFGDGTDFGVAPEDKKSYADEGATTVDVMARRRHGMQNYPDSVRHQLRKVRSRTPSDCKITIESDLRHSWDSSDSPPSVYSDASGYEDQILVSSARPGSDLLRPASRFSGHSIVDEEAGYRDWYEDVVCSLSQSTLDSATQENTSSDSGAAPPYETVPPSSKSWETFAIPSIPPSPVDSVPSLLPVAPRDPRLPPADYLLHKEVYDEAAISKYGSLPTEWVEYNRLHHNNRI
jgi:hypothetical protein